MNNTVTDSNVSQLAADAETPVSFPKWVKAVMVFLALMIPFSLYQREWDSLCMSLATLLIFLGRKEQQMSRPVKVIWVIATFGFMAVGSVLVFKGLFSRGR